MTPQQCRFARTLLNWSLLDLADNADLSTETISGYEAGYEEFMESVIASIQVTLEYAGVEFIALDENGVRLRS